MYTPSNIRLVFQALVAGLLQLLIGVAAFPVWAQRVGTLPVTSDAVFLPIDEPRNVALDAQGRLYVVASGGYALLRLDGALLHTEELGGPGVGGKAFGELADVDPTNGLLLVLADAGNGAIVRYSGEFKWLGTSRPSEPAERAGDPLPGAFADDRASVRPVAVATSRTRETFFVDEMGARVVKLNAAQQYERTIGGYGERAAPLVLPTDVATWEDVVYVLDAGTNEVVSFDLFGAPLDRIEVPAGLTGRRLVASREGVWVTTPRGLTQLSPSGWSVWLLTGEHRPLLDAAVTSNHFYLLFPDGLVRTPRQAAPPDE